jgi:membrane fusion protein (multidrug efflux system)
MPRAAKLALLLFGFLLHAIPAQAQFGPQGPPAVSVQEAARRPVTESTEFVGRVEATQRVDIRARVTGFLQEVLFREGQEVRRGAPLFRIERQNFEAEVERQRATVAAAEAEVANARVTLSRAQELSRTGAGTRANLDNAIAQERTANAQLLGARAALRTAEINLGYTEINSPIDGKIGRTVLTIGNVVGPDAGVLATIVSQDPMRVAYPVSQRQALELRDRYSSRGGVDAVRVRFRTADGRLYPHPGRIEFIDNQIDRNTDTILVRALVPNPPLNRATNPAANAANSGGEAGSNRELIDGQFVTVYVEGVEPVLAITVPRSAVLQDQQGSYVFIVDNEGKAQRRNLRLGRSTPQVAVVESGLNPGDKVIVEGIQRVRPGQQVNATPAAAPAAGDPAAPGPAGSGQSPPGAAPGGSAPGTEQGGAGGPPAGAPAAPNGGAPGASQPNAATPPPPAAGPGQSQPGTAR